MRVFGVGSDRIKYTWSIFNIRTVYRFFSAVLMIVAF